MRAPRIPPHPLKHTQHGAQWSYTGSPDVTLDFRGNTNPVFLNYVTKEYRPDGGLLTETKRRRQYYGPSGTGPWQSERMISIVRLLAAIVSQVAEEKDQ